MDVSQIFSELNEVKQEIFKRKVNNFQIAEHPSSFKGSGFEIHSVNKWCLGEPMINIDWSLSLLTWPKTIYKIDRIETKNAPAILIADISPSLFVEVEEATGRFRLLLHLVGGLGFAANYLHDPVGVLAVSRKVEFYLRPKLGNGQIFYASQLLLEKAEEFHKSKKTNALSGKSGIDSALKLLLSLTRRQRSIVVISDFADIINGESEVDFKTIEALSSLHNRNLVVIFLDDPSEFSWKHRQGVVIVRNIETGKLENVKAQRASDIRQVFCEKREDLREKFKDVGVDSVVLSFGDHFNQLSQFLAQRR